MADEKTVDLSTLIPSLEKAGQLAEEKKRHPETTAIYHAIVHLYNSIDNQSLSDTFRGQADGFRKVAVVSKNKVSNYEDMPSYDAQQSEEFKSVSTQLMTQVEPLAQEALTYASTYAGQASRRSDVVRAPLQLYVMLAQLDEDNALYRNKIGQCLTLLNDHQAAAVHFEEAVKLAPGNEEYLNDLRAVQQRTQFVDRDI